MSTKPKHDPQFEIEFFESVHRRCPDYLEVVGLLGGLYTRVGRITDGLKMDRKLVRLDPENPTAHYNLACSLALSNRPLDALETLATALQHGYDDYEWMRQDPDLQSLKTDPEFLRLLALAKAQSKPRRAKR